MAHYLRNKSFIPDVRLGYIETSKYIEIFISFSIENRIHQHCLARGLLTLREIIA